MLWFYLPWCSAGWCFSLLVPGMWAGHCTSSLLPCRGSSRLLLFVGLLFVPGMWAFFCSFVGLVAMVWFWPVPGMWAVVGSLFFLVCCVSVCPDVGFG